MKRALSLIVTLLSLAAIAANSTRIDFVPWAPVRLVKPTGVVTSRGVTADTDIARGDVFETLLTDAVAGDTIEVRSDCTIDVAPRKNGVRIVPLQGAVITNRTNLPTISPSNFPTTVTSLINRRRDVSMYAPEPEFLFYHHDFSTSIDAGETVFSTTNGTRTQGQGEFKFTTPSTGSGYLLAKKRFQGSAQLCAKVRVNSLNATGTFNDIAVGFAVTSTATSDVVTDKLLAFYGRTDANPAGVLTLLWSYNGGTQVYDQATLTTPLVTPFDLMLVMNNGSLALAVEENGVQRILMNKEVNQGIGFLSLEDQTNVAKLRPMLFFQSSQAIDARVTNFEVRALGELGSREHYPDTYENGEPIRNPQGLYYVTVDATHVTTVNLSGPAQYSEYMKNQSTTRLYDADTGRFVKNTAKYSIKKNGQVFGAQQGKVLYDRRTGLYHLYTSTWNDTSERVQMTHYATYDNLLHGYWVLDGSQFDVIDLSAINSIFVSPNYYYDTDVQKYNGRWYLCGTVSGIPVIGRAAFCVSGTAPNAFDTLEFVDTTVDEGTRFYRISGVPRVATGVANGDIKIMDLTGTSLRTISGMGTSGYSVQASLLPVVRGGRTQYQAIAFTDSTRPAAPNVNLGGDDYKADFTGQVQSLSFGSTAVWDLGTFDGEEYTDQPRTFNP